MAKNLRRYPVSTESFNISEERNEKIKEIEKQDSHNHKDLIMEINFKKKRIIILFSFANFSLHAVMYLFYSIF